MSRGTTSASLHPSRLVLENGGAETTVYSRVKIAGHPLHPILVTFPVAFHSATFASYVVYAVTQNPFSFRVAVVANVAGVVTSIAAAIAGFVDWRWGIPGGHPAKAVGLLHMALNLLGLAAFVIAASVGVHKFEEVAPTFGIPLVFSGVGFILMLAAGYLGGELVQRHHVGIDLTAEQTRIDAAHAAHPGPKSRRAARGA